ncbi:MAG: hypothetical protein CUN55_17315, partial [Phototrophicales bacterium]
MPDEANPPNLTSVHLARYLAKIAIFAIILLWSLIFVLDQRYSREHTTEHLNLVTQTVQQSIIAHPNYKQALDGIFKLVLDKQHQITRLIIVDPINGSIIADSRHSTPNTNINDALDSSSLQAYIDLLNWPDKNIARIDTSNALFHTKLALPNKQ